MRKSLDTGNWLTERLSWEVPALLGGTGAPVTATPLTVRTWCFSQEALLPARPTSVGRPSSGIKWLQTPAGELTRRVILLFTAVSSSVRWRNARITGGHALLGSRTFPGDFKEPTRCPSNQDGVNPRGRRAGREARRPSGTRPGSARPRRRVRQESPRDSAAPSPVTHTPGVGSFTALPLTWNNRVKCPGPQPPSL